MIKKKDFISILDFSKKELLNVIALTETVKSRPKLFSKRLLHRNIALIFAKPSLRTRVSFEVGINQLGGNPIVIKMDEINVGTRENVEDIANVLSRYVEAIVIRTFEQSQIQELGKFATVPVVNSLSNDEHPCQIISDLFTIKEHFKTLSGLKVAYIGDGNNIAHSLLLGCALAGINVSVSTPKNYEPQKSFVSLARKINPKINIEITNSPEKAAKDSNVLYTDVWTSMGQEKEKEKRKRIFSKHQINDSLLKKAKNNAIVLHCLPAHKGEEISSKIFDRFSEIIYKQAENRLYTQKAILLYLIKPK